ncbi:uncharacterized protein LOC135840015 [Planococcus citri]|uniref:uncharacterized protein LOC135840015 n=1 Tax=Planococcus citri TaxID=170843 RepID=UPI0031F8DD63
MTPQKTEVLWIVSILLCLNNCVKNDVLSESSDSYDSDSFSSESEFTSEETDTNKTIRALRKHGVTDQMVDKFNEANAQAEKITTDFIAKQLKTLNVKTPLDNKQCKELAKEMLEGVRMWFVALEIGLPTMSEYIKLIKKYNSTSLELSLHINYFLTTTSSAEVDNKLHNTIVDTMREAGVKNSEISEAVQPEALGYMGNEKLAQELVQLVLATE